MLQQGRKDIIRNFIKQGDKDKLWDVVFTGWRKGSLYDKPIGKEEYNELINYTKQYISENANG